jgi:septal ring factor EnvC (AmiA/AmiB activator)
MKKLILIPVLLSAIIIFAQKQNTEQQKQQQEIVSLNQKLNSQRVSIGQQNAEIAKLSLKSENHNKQIDSLKAETIQNIENIQKIANDLGTKLQQKMVFPNWTRM